MSKNSPKKKKKMNYDLKILKKIPLKNNYRYFIIVDTAKILNIYKLDFVLIY